MTDNKCAKKIKASIEEGSRIYWKARAEQYGVLYEEGDTANTIAARIREKKKEKEVEPENDKTELDELRELAVELLARIDVLEGV